MNLTIPEAAVELRCSPKTVRRAIKRGELPAVLFGGRYLIPKDGLPSAFPASPSPVRPRKPAGQFVALVREMDAA